MYILNMQIVTSANPAIILTWFWPVKPRQLEDIMQDSFPNAPNYHQIPGTVTSAAAGSAHTWT